MLGRRRGPAPNSCFYADQIGVRKVRIRGGLAVVKTPISEANSRMMERP